MRGMRTSSVYRVAVNAALVIANQAFGAVPLITQDAQPLLSKDAENVSVGWADIASGLTDTLSVLSSEDRLYPYLDPSAPLSQLNGIDHHVPPAESQMTAAELVTALQAGGRDLYHSCQLASVSRNGTSDRSARGTLAEKLVPKLLMPAAAKVPHSFGGAQLNLFAASAHSCTPAHYDGRQNSIVQLEGMKRVWLWSPEEASNIFNWFPSASEAHRTARRGPISSIGGAPHRDRGARLGSRRATERLLRQGSVLRARVGRPALRAGLLGASGLHRRRGGRVALAVVHR